MTTSTSQAGTGWSDLLLRAIVELRELSTSLRDFLGEDTREDLSRLFDGAARLEQMLADPEQRENRHDLMNALAAIRGYAEMLREDVGSDQAELDDTLARLLMAVHTAQGDGNGTETVAAGAPKRVIESEPGFILAVVGLLGSLFMEVRELANSFAK